MFLPGWVMPKKVIFIAAPVMVVLKQKPMKLISYITKVIWMINRRPYLSAYCGAQKIVIIRPKKKQEPRMPTSDYGLQSMSNFSTQLSKYSSSDFTALYLFLGNFSAQISLTVQAFQECMWFYCKSFILTFENYSHSYLLGTFSRKANPLVNGITDIRLETSIMKQAT